MCNTSHTPLLLSFFPSRVEEKPREADNLSLRLQYHKDKKQYHTDFTIPCCYLSGHRHSSDAIRARVLSPVMGVEIRPNNKTAKGERILVSILTLGTENCLAGFSQPLLFKAKYIILENIAYNPANYWV